MMENKISLTKEENILFFKVLREYFEEEYFSEEITQGDESKGWETMLDAIRNHELVTLIKILRKCMFNEHTFDFFDSAKDSIIRGDFWHHDIFCRELSRTACEKQPLWYREEISVYNRTFLSLGIGQILLVIFETLVSVASSNYECIVNCLLLFQFGDINDNECHIKLEYYNNILLFLSDQWRNDSNKQSCEFQKKNKSLDMIYSLLSSGKYKSCGGLELFNIHSCYKHDGYVGSEPVQFLISENTSIKFICDLIGLFPNETEKINSISVMFINAIFANIRLIMKSKDDCLLFVNALKRKRKMLSFVMFSCNYRDIIHTSFLKLIIPISIRQVSEYHIKKEYFVTCDGFESDFVDVLFDSCFEKENDGRYVWKLKFHPNEHHSTDRHICFFSDLNQSKKIIDSKGHRERIMQERSNLSNLIDLSTPIEFPLIINHSNLPKCNQQGFSVYEKRYILMYIMLISVDKYLISKVLDDKQKETLDRYYTSGFFDNELDSGIIRFPYENELIDIQPIIYQMMMDHKSCRDEIKERYVFSHILEFFLFPGFSENVRETYDRKVKFKTFCRKCFYGNIYLFTKIIPLSSIFSLKRKGLFPSKQEQMHDLLDYFEGHLFFMLTKYKPPFGTSLKTFVKYMDKENKKRGDHPNITYLIDKLLQRESHIKKKCKRPTSTLTTDHHQPKQKKLCQ